MIHVLRDNELFGALESDLKIHCNGTDIRGLWTTPRQITYRQVATWIRHLPADSALGRRGKAGDTKPSMTERLHAMQINETKLSNFLYLKRNGDPKKTKRLEYEPLDLDELGEE